MNTEELEHQIAILERTPGVLRALLGGHSPHWTRSNYGEGTFSPLDVVGHLIDCERENWMPRARAILEHGASRPFSAFDQTSSGAGLENMDVGDRLDLFERLRGESLRELRAMDLHEQALARAGVHPALGEVTVGQLIATWATHDLHHIAQVCRAMAHQNRDRVGPWRAYLRILSS